MILVHLKKDPDTTKMMIIGWEFVSKQAATSIVVIKGMREIVEEKDLPPDFFKSYKYYYLEDGMIGYIKTE